MIAFALFALGVLLNSLWEAPLIAVLTALGLRFAPRSTASTRYAVWFTAFVAGAAFPIATTAVLVGHSATYAKNAVHTAAPPAATSEAHLPPAKKTVVQIQKAPASAQNEAPAAGIRPYHPKLSVDARVAIGVGVAWLALFLFFIARLAREIFVLERLKRDALPLPFEYRETLRRWSQVEHNRKDVRLCVSTDTEVPIAVGLFDSMILLPDHLLATLSPDEIDQIALHELAHLRRADDWSNALQRLGTTLYFFNPAMRWMGAQLDLEREVACDDHVIVLSSDVRMYAHCLTKMAEVTAWPHVPLAAPGVFVTRKSISIRIERLLKLGADRRISVSYSTALAAVCAGAAVFVCSLAFAPVLASPLSPEIALTTKPRVKPVTHHISPRNGKQTHSVPARSSSRPEQPMSLPSPPAQHVAMTTPASPAHNAVVTPKTLTKILAAPPANNSAHAVASSAPSAVAVPPSPPTVAYNPHTTTAHGQTNAVQCDGCNFEGVDWHGRDLRGVALRGANLENANLRNADLRGADLTGANLAGAHLEGARLDGTRLTGANLSDVWLRGVDLSGANITGANVMIRGADGATTRALLERCHGCDFARMDARNLDLHGISVVGANMDHADLRGADLRNVRFSGVNLDGAQLQGAKLAGSAFVGCSMNGADFRGVDLSQVRLTGSNLTGAIMP